MSQLGIAPALQHIMQVVDAGAPDGADLLQLATRRVGIGDPVPGDKNARRCRPVTAQAALPMGGRDA